MGESSPVVKGKVGIVTVTYNSESVLKDFFDSLAAQTHRKFVLYLVDNASKDKSLQMAAGRPEIATVVLANLKNLGIAEGNNQGIRAALADGCECILLLNNDTVFPSDLIERLYAGLEDHQSDMTTGKMYYHDRPDFFWCAGGDFESSQSIVPSHEGLGQKDNGQYDAPRRVTYAPTCCLLARHTVFGRVGMMDSNYFVYYDDTDFLLRCFRSGIVLWYLPDARLWHKVASLTSANGPVTAHLVARSRIYHFRKHASRRRARLLYWKDQLRLTLKLLLGRIPLGTWRAHRSGAQEGWTISLR